MQKNRRAKAQPARDATPGAAISRRPQSAACLGRNPRRGREAASSTGAAISRRPKARPARLSLVSVRAPGGGHGPR